MRDAITFWLAREAINVAVLVALVLLTMLFVGVQVLWERVRAKRQAARFAGMLQGAQQQVEQAVSDIAAAAVARERHRADVAEDTLLRAGWTLIERNVQGHRIWRPPRGQCSRIVQLWRDTESDLEAARLALAHLLAAARSSGGVAGGDPVLMAACDRAEQVLRSERTPERRGTYAD